MEHYKKVKTVEHNISNPFSDLLNEEDYKLVEVKISPKSVLNKVVGFASNKLKKSNIDAVLLVGCGNAVELVRKCCQILNKKFKTLHQCDANSKKVFEDYWMCENKSLDLDMLSVQESIPVLFILLAKDKLPDKLQMHPNRLISR